MAEIAPVGSVWQWRTNPGRAVVVSRGFDGMVDITWLVTGNGYRVGQTDCRIWHETELAKWAVRVPGEERELRIHAAAPELRTCLLENIGIGGSCEICWRQAWTGKECEKCSRARALLARIDAQAQETKT